MPTHTLSEDIENKVLAAQKSEITEYNIYKKLAVTVTDPHNRKILERIANEELQHYRFWKRYTGKEPEPDKVAVITYLFLARLLGLTFSMKLMEKGEKAAQLNYQEIAASVPEAQRIIDEENEHEKLIIDLIKEEQLEYAGSVVLGLNDALMELTGALAGLTLALQQSRLIAMVGLITGIAASLSMAASEYLSTKTESGIRNPVKSAVYTGTAYILTVILLILTYMLFGNPYVSLTLTISIALMVIFVFNYYLSVVKDVSFWKRFAEMAIISLGVAVLTFIIGWIIRLYFNIEV